MKPEIHMLILCHYNGDGGVRQSLTFYIAVNIACERTSHKLIPDIKALKYISIPDVLLWVALTLELASRNQDW